ncbi:MAG: hypothetical protein CVV64_12590 [Candidatus Wallbacteria bacterium HGW-Wallbacteria-1]|jgi:putative peptide zinc metalloprotease protein|uniref:Uncharacterized protein n=1 Tax=Candidatus Wallbacteria bacterium HGW-Wallbacteria-1 TaxID=2013854 RepID=A0A2N1PN59_9BACT|nr:MAG: hypothetical protein CVV64_12590 [Candidatus Wallbacteria bacterium HGW-Wallbacteria-1]
MVADGFMNTSSPRLFHDNWYQVSELRFRLNPWVRVHRQTWRGELWFLLSDPFTGKHFRIQPETWRFILLLDGRLTLDEAWRRSLEICPGETPGQVELITLLAQVNRENLLGCDRPRDLEALFEGQERIRAREWRSRLMNFLFIPIPLWNPDSFLRKLLPLGRLIFSIFGLLVWTGALAAALASLAGSTERLMAPIQGMLALENLPWLYLSWALVKLVHEMGHALCCRTFGGQVTLMGIMLLVFAPIPYVDTSSAWMVRERWKRVLINASGMVSELFLASLAALVWCFTGQGVIHSLAWNIAMIASVSTIIFNINPLLRLDGYYILSDLADIPNLHQRAVQSLSQTFDRVVFGVVPPHFSPEIFLCLYGLASGLYRITISVLIIAMVAEKFFEVGLILGLLCLVFWVIAPLFGFFRYLLTDRGMGVSPARRVLTAATLAGLMAALLLAIPFPVIFSVPGVVCGRGDSDIIVSSSGRVNQVFFKSGEQVNEGDVIIQLEDEQLDLEMKRLQARSDEIGAAISALSALEPGRVEFHRLQMGAVKTEMDRVSRLIDGLTIKAPVQGILWLPDPSRLQGQWLRRGQVTARVLDSGLLQFHATIPQEQGTRLYEMKNPRVMVRLSGMGFRNLSANLDRISPSERNLLPSASLGMAAGGSIAVDLQDTSGLKTREPCFDAFVELRGLKGENPGFGRTGRAFFKLGQLPLGHQLLRWFRQLLQKRYQL